MERQREEDKDRYRERQRETKTVRERETETERERERGRERERDRERDGERDGRTQSPCLRVLQAFPTCCSFQFVTVPAKMQYLAKVTSNVAATQRCHSTRT